MGEFMMDCIPVMRVSALLLLSLSVVAATASNGTADVVFTFKNRCSQNLWMGAQGMSNVRPSFQFNGLNFFAPNNGGSGPGLGVQAQWGLTFTVRQGTVGPGWSALLGIFLEEVLPLPPWQSSHSTLIIRIILIFPLLMGSTSP